MTNDRAMLMYAEVVGPPVQKGFHWQLRSGAWAPKENWEVPVEFLINQGTLWPGVTFWLCMWNAPVLMAET